jgi:DNA-binding CsgD family transcriptional regulator
MGEPLGLSESISEDTLQGAFPFIHQGGGKVTSAEATSQDLHDSHCGNPFAIGLEQRPFPAEIFSDLTKGEMQRVLEILHYAVQATTGDDVYHVLQLIKHLVACPRVIGGVAQLNSKGTFREFNSVINVSYSNDWLYTYGTKGYASVDPVLQSVLSTFKTQVWEQTYKRTSSQKQLEFIEEARSYGLTHGITAGMLERRRGFATFFSFAGGDSADTNRYKGLFEYLLPYLHRTLIANTHTPLPNRVKGLSPREMMVLTWMKQGKTNWEISRIIGVSERTVRFHVESIFMKLDVGSRTQAVAFAMEHGLFP